MTRFVDEVQIFAVKAFFDTVVGGAMRLGRRERLANPELHEVEFLGDHRYAPGTTTRDHLLDIWRPTDDAAKSRSRLPIVFHVHGGGFTVLSKEAYWRQAVAFARRGFLVFNVSYRLAPKHRFPTAVEDVFSAFEWVVENAARFGGDTSRIVLAGESAGANLVTGLSLALAYERPEPFAKRIWQTNIRPSAVVPACGIFHCSDHPRFREDVPWYFNHFLYGLETAYLGKGPWPCALDFVDLASFFERGIKPDRPLPPFFLPVGDLDPLLSDTKRIGRALRGLGAEATERTYAGMRHVFHLAMGMDAAKRCWNDTFAFLDRHVPTDHVAPVSGDRETVAREAAAATGT